MSDRFYLAQLERTGWMPIAHGEWVHKPHRRKRMAWTDETKAQAVEMYQEQEPTPETSMEVVKEIADELGESPNGVRMILTKAGVYVRKTPAARSTSGGSTGGGRVSVADAQESLTTALKDAGQTVDDAIISKLTGKAAVYFKTVVEALNS